MSNFDEWFKEKDPFNGNANNSDCEWAKRFMRVAFEAGAASRQTEIDDLMAKKEFRDLSQDLAIKKIKDSYDRQVSGLAKAITKLEHENDELQKRIDDALMAFQDESFNYCEKILKGESK